MSREIKFRAWDKVKEIFTNYQIVDGMLYFMDKHTGVWKRDDKEKSFILMQSTGFLDKNGVEIFEGDILYFEPHETHSNDRVVEYIDGAYHGRLIRNGYSKLLAECVYETRVIGNIYENPELLKEDKRC